MAVPIAGFTQQEWDNLVKGAQAGREQIAQTGTINGATPNQNLAAVANQTGNTSGATAKPYITPSGTTDYHITGGSYTPPPSGGGGSTPAPSAPVTPQQQQQATNTTAQPVSAQQSYQPPDYAALAAARTALALRQKQTIAQQQKDSADAAYNKQNLRTQDNRALENGQINRTLSPFAGKTAYDKGLIGRERTQADADSAAALATQKGNIDQLLADYQNSTADEQIRIADELKRADQQYQLQLSAQTGTMADGTRNLAGQQYDWNTSPNNPSNQGQVLQNQGQAQQNLLNQYKIDSYPAEQQANATKVQQELAAGKLDLETAKYNFEQLKDPNSTTNQANKIDLQLKQLDLKNAPEKARLEIQQLQKQIAQIGVVHYKPQTDAEIAQDKVTLATANKQLADIANGKYPGDKPPTTTEDNNQYIADVVTNVDLMTPENKKSFFTNEKAALIRKLGKSGYDNLYNDYFNADGTLKSG